MSLSQENCLLVIAVDLRWIGRGLMFFIERLSSITGAMAGFFVSCRSMYFYLLSVILAAGFFVFPLTSWAKDVNEFQFAFPYSVRKGASSTFAAGSTNMLQVAFVTSFADNTQAEVKIELPQGLKAVSLPDGWREQAGDSGTVIVKDFSFEPFYDSRVELLSVKADSAMPEGDYTAVCSAIYGGNAVRKTAVFNVSGSAASGGWQAERLVLPVDRDGNRDDKEEAGLIYINDWSMEALRSLASGRGAVSLNALSAHPVAYMRVDADNPSLDRQVLHIKAELVDKATGSIVKNGLRQPDSQDEDGAELQGDDHSSQVLVSLDGSPKESFVVPLYADEDLEQGKYMLRVTASGGGRSFVLTEDINVVARRSSTTYVLLAGFLSTVCFAFYFWRYAKSWLDELGARGVITVALFAAVSFGGITLPTTFLEDFLKVFFGPFYPFFTGLLTSSFYYLLLIALFLLYPARGTAALWVVLRWLLSALLLGRITPVGIMVSCVQAVALETAFYLFYRKGWTEGPRQRFMLAAGMALCDCIATFVKLELMIFFYRLYYADWYIAVYVVVCGFVYTALGSWMGYAMGLRLRNVTGE